MNEIICWQGLDQVKKMIDKHDLEENEEPLSCRSLRKIKLKKSKHFDADVSLEHTSVHVAAEVFDCGEQFSIKYFYNYEN